MVGIIDIAILLGVGYVAITYGPKLLSGMQGDGADSSDGTDGSDGGDGEDGGAEKGGGNGKGQSSSTVCVNGKCHTSHGNGSVATSCINGKCTTIHGSGSIACVNGKCYSALVEQEFSNVY